MKEVHGKLYMHWSAMDFAPIRVRTIIKDALRILKASGKDLPGPIFDLVKWDKYDQNSISFLWYEDFDKNAHPALYFSAKVTRDTEKITTANYKNNRPILHRKDSMVDINYKFFDKFYALTQKEEEHGLLNRSDIGREEQWSKVLKQKGLKIVGHSVRKVR